MKDSRKTQTELPSVRACHAELAAAERAAGEAELLLSIGTSGLVYPAAGLPLFAKRQGACLVEINPAPTPLSEFSVFVLSGAAGVVLPEMVARVKLGD